MGGTQVIYIVGLSHSGSTLLAMLLGSHPQALATGEMKTLSTSRKLWRRHNKGVIGDGLDRPCSCGASSILACSFWQRVEKILHERLGHGLDRIELGQSDVNEFRQHSQALYDAIHQVSDGRTIVDSSKDISLLLRLLNETELFVRPLLLVRRMEGVVASNIHKGRNWVHILLQSTVALAVARYRLKGLEHLVINYEELAASPEAVLGTIWAWLGVSFHEAWPEWTASEHHLLAGNRIRKNPNPHIRVDDVWRQELSTVQKWACGMGNVLAESTLFQWGLMWWISRGQAQLD